MRLPPPNALRAFEAAARHGGFIGASEELNVTRGAISRHVKLLEEQLGVPLFRRHARGVELTDAGRRLQPVLTDAFHRIAREVAQLSADAAELRIICPPATSIRWLIPRLDGFRRRHPEIEVRLTTGFPADQHWHMRDHDIAFSLEHCARDGDSVVVEALFPETITPACTPEIARRLTHPDDLRGFTLLHETPARDDWKAWLAAFPVAGLDARSRGSDFPNRDLATRAAIMGAGVVMVDFVLCRDEIASGALVLPFPDRVCAGPFGAFCIVGARDTWESEKVRAFRAWLRDAVAEDDAQAQAG